MSFYRAGLVRTGAVLFTAYVAVGTWAVWPDHHSRVVRYAIGIPVDLLAAGVAIVGMMIWHQRMIQLERLDADVLAHCDAEHDGVRCVAMHGHLGDCLFMFPSELNEEAV